MRRFTQPGDVERTRELVAKVNYCCFVVIICLLINSYECDGVEIQLVPLPLCLASELDLLKVSNDCREFNIHCVLAKSSRITFSKLRFSAACD